MDNNAQKCLDKLCKELLGNDYYIVDPVGVNQANEIITNEIIRRYKPRKSIVSRFIDSLKIKVQGD